MDITIEEIKQSDMVYFSASWCAPCKVTKPLVEKVQSERDEVIKIVVIDELSDASMDEIKTEFKIRSVPTTLFFKDGEESNRVVGGYTESKIVELLKQNLNA